MDEVEHLDRRKATVAKELLETCFAEAKAAVGKSAMTSVDGAAVRWEWFPGGITSFEATVKVSEYFEVKLKLSGPESTAEFFSTDADDDD